MSDIVYKKLYFIIDCNNFFVSCEQLFRPDLINKPVVVLSSNDSCVISRSDKAKAIGIKMGEPVFKIKELILRHKVALFSANFNLYCNISNRVMRTLESLCANVYTYSIDEAFLVFENMTIAEANDKAIQLKNTILNFIGIQTCVGIAQTKTLAKLANNYAKSHKKLTQGIHLALDQIQINNLLKVYPINEIWGIGKATEQKLSRLNIKSALELCNLYNQGVFKGFNINLRRTIMELNNIDALDTEFFDEKNQMQICVSHSFDQKVSDIQSLNIALNEYIQKASLHLRKINKFTKKITIHIRSSYFDNTKKYSSQESFELINPTNDTRVLLHIGRMLLESCFEPGILYAKAGVILSDFYDSAIGNYDLFEKQEEYKNSELMMKSMDEHNLKNSKNKMHIGVINKISDKQSFYTKNHLSSDYTSSFLQLPKIK